MKKYSYLLLSALLFVLLAFPTIQAQAQSSIIGGQNHKYNVHLRTNGEAVVTSRITFANNTDESQTSLRLGIEGQITELYVAQIIKPKTCSRYDYSRGIGGSYRDKCLEYKDSDYDNFYTYGSDRSQYYKLTPSIDGTQYDLPLNTPVEPNGKSAVVLAFATKSYVKDGLGNKSFDIPTIKVDQRIQQADVAVTFDGDVYYDGKKASTQYKDDVSTGLNSLSTGVSANSESLDRGISNIGSYGALEKHASSLAPGDVFHTKGTYATSWFGMYYKWLLVVLLGIIGLIVGVWLIARWQEKAFFSRKGPKKINQSIESSTQDVPVVSYDTLNSVKDDGAHTAPLLISKPERDVVTTSKGTGTKFFGTSTSTSHIYLFRVRLTPYFGAFILSLLSLVISVIISLGYAFFVNLMIPNYSSSGVEYISSYLGIAGIAIVFIATFTVIPVWLIRRRGLRVFYVYLICLAVWLLLAVATLKPFIPTRGGDYYQRHPYGGDMPL